MRRHAAPHRASENLHLLLCPCCLHRFYDALVSFCTRRLTVSLTNSFAKRWPRWSGSGNAYFQRVGLSASPFLSLIGRTCVGVYGEYLDKQFTYAQLAAERKGQLARIATARGRDVLVYAADLNKPRAPVTMNYGDILPITDQLANLKGDRLDLVLETPGGSGEVAEDIVRILRTRYDDIAVIVPGWAKSAGTIVALSADEILMGPTSALGPIDAQLLWQGKVFSAGALLDGFEKIKREVEGSGTLNKAYIPVLQGISPGDLQNAENALGFSRTLVTQWLVRYKFRGWTHHSSTGQPVTQQEKEARAHEVASVLCDHSRWLTHGRSIRLDDLLALRLRVTNYGASADLADVIGRYYALLQMTFESNVYKLIETPTSQIMRFLVQAAPPPQKGAKPDIAVLEYRCEKCGQETAIQANLGGPRPLQAGHVPFPPNNSFRCPNCGAEANLSEARRQIEAQTRKAVVA